MEYYARKVHYFDASALVKLVADDRDEEPADRGLAKAARPEGARAWECTTETAPA
jgi:hypothetical protein